MTGKKEYTIKINGISQSVKEVTTLEEAVNSLDASIKTASAETVKAATESRKKAQALTEEEKAEQKLQQTLQRAANARSEANRAQIEANIAAREAQREVTREIQLSQQAEGSIKQLGMQLTDLRNRYDNLSRAQREDISVGGELLEQIKALDTEYKGLRESTGRFQDSVGNYEKGLKILGTSIDGVTKTSIGLSQTLLASNQLLGLFGNRSEESAESAKRLQQVIALLSLAQQVNNNLIQSGTLLKIRDAAAEKLRAAQTAISTAATNASSFALGLFRKALIATGIGAFVVLVGTLVANFDRVKKTVTDLIPGLKDAGVLFDEIKAVVMGVGEALINFVITPFKAVAAFIRGVISGDIKGAIQDGLEAFKNGYNVAANYQSGYEKQTARNLQTANRERAKLRAEELDNLIKDNEAKYGSDWQYTTEAQKLYAELFAAKKIMYANDKEAYREVQREEWQYLFALQERSKQALSDAKSRQEEEISIIRAAEDARVKLIQNSYERSRKAVSLSYDRQIDDIRKRLATETDLTVKAREALNDTIKSLEQQKDNELEELQKEHNENIKSLERELEDSRTALIEDSYQRQTAEITLQYDRQIEAYKQRLEEDKDLTEEQQSIITELILNAQSERGKALERLIAEQSRKQADLQLRSIQTALAEAQSRIGNTVVRQSGGLELIDVEATRKNLDTLDAAFGNYIKGLGKYQTDLQNAHQKTLSTLKEGSTEYAEELNNYARANIEVTGLIVDAQNQQAANAKKATNLQLAYYTELFTKVSDIVSTMAMLNASLFDTISLAIEGQIEQLNEELDAINERYEEAKKLREDAVKSVEETEEKLRNATGGTAIALREQLKEEMAARQEAEREEQRLAKEKEKREADIAKKEKQLRKNDLRSNIGQAIANTAQSATRALTVGPILGPILASLMTALGLAQVGIMSRQLAKLEKGGEIVGPSHANGGVPIVIDGQPSYEAQGGEFMVNDKSYGANKALVNYINDTPRAITAADLAGIVPGGNTPVIVTETNPDGEDRIIEAIEGIEIHPAVAVSDILDVSEEVVGVRDTADY